jgi:hypothetical protein
MICSIMKKDVKSDSKIVLNVGTKTDATLTLKDSKERFASQTNWKLSEAEFFLERLEKFKVTPEDENALEKTYDFLKTLTGHAQEDENNRMARDFCYYLSAFLSAYRSIPDVMSAEYKASGFDITPVYKIIDTDSEMKLLRLLRDAVVHQKLVSLHPRAHVSMKQGEEGKGGFTWYFSEDIKDLKVRGEKKIAKINDIDNIIKNHDIITICSGCMKEIKKCVFSCEKNFSVARY